MSTPSRTAVVWMLRLLGVGLLVWVLATQVQWWDRMVLRDGQIAEGAVERLDDDTYRFTERKAIENDPRAMFVDPAWGDYPAELIATRTYGDRAVPDITYGARTLLKRLGRNLPTVVLVLAGLTLLVVLTALRWKLLLRGVAIVVPFLRVMRLTFIGGFFNMAVPGATGGDIVKAWYASKEARSRYPELKGVGTKAVLSVFVDRFVGLFGLVVFAAGVLVVVAHGEAYRVPRIAVLSIMGGAMAAGVVILSKPIRRALGLSWLVKRLPLQHVLEELRASARLYKGHVPTLAGALGISLFNHAGNATACWLLAGALGIEGVTLGAAMAMVPLANLLSAIPLLPGGWGVGELAFAYFFGLVGVPATEAVGLSVVFRLAVLGVNLPGGLLWIFWKGHPSTETIAAEFEEATSHVAEPSGEENE